nr:MAG TPA: hypothetical protein [Caudoviricetes sp.]
MTLITELGSDIKSNAHIIDCLSILNCDLVPSNLYIKFDIHSVLLNLINVRVIFSKNIFVFLIEFLFRYIYQCED